MLSVECFSVFIPMLLLSVCVLQEMGAKVSDDELRDLIAEVDINKNATIEEEEFLQVHV